MATVAWVHYKAVEPSCTDTTCYWKKSALSAIDLTLHPSKMTPHEIAVDLKSAYRGNGLFLEKLKPVLMQLKVPSMLRSQLKNTSHPLCMQNLMHQFATSQVRDKSFQNFKDFVSASIRSLGKKIERETMIETRRQGESALWRLLRFGRVTASSLSAAAGCQKDSSEERMKRTVFGTEKFHPTLAMQRGLRIEDEVRQQFCKDRKRKVQLGHFLMSEELPLFGASPDGIGTDFILEIKSPSDNKNINNYIKVDGTPTRKVLLQVLLQLKMSGKQRAYLLIADQDFEKNKLYKTIEVYYDEQSTEQGQLLLKNIFKEAISNAEEFYKKNIYYELVKRMRPILN